jgi:hypothetical protein
MASNELIDEVISPKASQQVVQLTNDLERLSLQFEATFKNAKALTDALEGAKNIPDTSRGTDDTRKSLNELEKIKVKLLQTEEKLAVASSEANKSLIEQKDALQQVNREIKEKLKFEQAEEGSINQMRSNLKQLQSQYDALGKSTRDAFGAPLLKQIQAVDTELKKLEGGSGRFQRNVGNYSNATFQLSQSLRELPAFAFSAQTGILALSNNLPMLIDEFNRTSKGVKQVKNELGEMVNDPKGGLNGASGAMKIFGQSIFSFTNLFTIALGLFTVFYKEILAFATGTKMANNELTNLSKTVGADIAQSKMYIGIIENMNISTEKRIIAAKKLIEIYPETLKNYSAEEIAAGKASEAIDRITNSIISYARIKAIQTDIDRLATKEFELQGQKQIEIHDQLQMRYEKDAIESRLKLLKPATNAYDIEIDKLITINREISQSEKLVKSYDEQLKIVAGSMTTLSARASDLLPKVLDEKAPKTDKKPKITTPKKEQEVNRIEELKNQYENERKVAQTHYEKGEYDYLLYQHNLIMIDEKYSKIKIDARNQKEKDSLIELNLALAKNTRESFKGLGELAAERFKAGFDEYNKGKKFEINDNIVKKAKEDLEKFQTYLKNLPKANISIKSKDLIDWDQFRRDAEVFLAYLQDMISAFGNLGMEARRAELYEIDVKENKLNESYKAEQDRINKSYTNRAQKEQELIKLDARKEAQQKQIDRARLQATIRAAKFQKGIDIAELVAKTAQAVMAGYTKSGLVGAAMAGALGSVQLATIMARPLPQFAKGTESSPEGYAVVGEKGTELVTDPSGKSWLTPAKDTITYLKKGSKVTTNEKLMEMVKNSAYVQLANLNTPVTSDMYSKTLVEQFETLTSKVDKLSNIMQDKAMSVQIQGNYDHYIHVRNNIR